MVLSLSSEIAISVPQYVACILFVTASVIASQLALTLFNKWAARYKLEFHNEVAAIVFGGISLIYSLVLAFVIVAVWDDYTDLEKTIEAEADKLNAIIEHTEALPDSIQASIKQTIYSYCDEVVNNEWQMSAKTKVVEKPNTMRGLRRQLLITDVEDKKEQNVLAVIDNNLSTLDDLRRDRLNHSHSQVPSMVWFILDTGSIMMIVFFFFLSMPSLKLKRIYLSFLVGCMAMCMFLVYTLDHPFNCKNGVSSELYQDIQNELKSLGNTNTPPN
ncbi:MAG TPA: DUF4239 domain-containing protein [Parafilimonas sp.]|nr:DUF4239 domain-containing protein [Parafilimonas sp.]